MAKSRIEFNFDFGDFENDIRQIIIDEALNGEHDIECPHCQNALTAKAGSNTCPNCNNIVELDIEITD